MVSELGGALLGVSGWLRCQEGIVFEVGGSSSSAILSLKRRRMLGYEGGLLAMMWFATGLWRRRRMRVVWLVMVGCG